MTTDQNIRRIAQFRIWTRIALHLGPGLLAVSLFVLLSTLLPADRFPPFLILQITLPVALLPMVYFVWWKKNFYIGVIAHCALNLVSDVFLAIPILLT
jgi:hypothetical protein